MRRGARFSRDRRFRYALTREWDPARPRCAFVLLNPSTADERVDDPTIRRCVGFARRWGYGGTTVVNLFAIRSADPCTLRAARDPIGARNDRALLVAAREAAVVVLGWGAHGALGGRSERVRDLLRPYGPKLRAFGWTRSGEPAHPLYLRRDARLRRA